MSSSSMSAGGRTERDDDGGDGGGGACYELMAGGRGVLISLRNDGRTMSRPPPPPPPPRRIDDVNDDGGGAVVLTTSPYDSAVADARRKDDDDAAVTTIAIECAECKSDTRAEAGARAFVSGPEKLGIVLCSNRLSSQAEVDEVLVHELVHIYDAHSRRMDLRDCRQLAYSEVRAAREAECSNRMTSFTANICAKETATRATRNMFPERGRQCVCDVFDVAVKDHAPFVAKSAKDVAFFRREAGFGGMGSSPPPPPPARRTSAFVEKGQFQQQQQQQPCPSFPPPRWSDR
ncbi:hypothetical protein ACHAW5_001909 [Stephanodiscus triporus]|uniref:Mitochondrial inner membrane protease ATP23 n=1 Tax=Stephanodiscus triporus TaxID=2934178 RepID=A0ABD3NA92_9STRA